MSSGQSNIQILDKILKGLSLTILLYPLERIQSIKQIQTTYSNPSIHHHPSIFSLSIHHGIQSYFRGVMSFITKSTILTLSSKISQFAFARKNIDQNMKRLLFFGFSTFGYIVTYPLQIVNLRMSTQIQGQRFYSTIKECLLKIKKNEGYRTMYRAFPLSYSVFATQILSVDYMLTSNIISNPESSQWKKILTIFALINLSEIILYPLISLKKIIQINGAIGHSDSNYSLRMALRKNSWIHFWRGCQIKVINIFLYTLLYLSYFGSQMIR